jgi:hypothetical protein
MNLLTLDNQSILHCSDCGGSFFEENGINRISEFSAKKLAEDRKTDVILGVSKLCPKDKSPLLAIMDNTAIPPNVTLLRCSQCHGVFSYADDLLKFKEAQAVKTNYFKVWQLPLPSLKEVLVLMFIAAAFLSTVYSFGLFTHRASRETQAQDLIKKVNISYTSPYLFISFRTTTPATSVIVFRNLSRKTVVTKTLSSTFSTLHFLSTGDINPEDEVYFQIICLNEKGQEIKTEERRLSL